MSEVEQGLASIGLDKDGLNANPNTIRTFTGRKVDPLRVTEDDIAIEDIAHSLSRQCRYNGHCVGFLSVARHSLWVAQRLDDLHYGDVELVLSGLLHDAAETWLGDVPRPLKQNPAFGEVYGKAERLAELAVNNKYGVDVWHTAVKDADHHVLTAVELMPGGARETWNGDPEEDERDFLSMFGFLYALHTEEVHS